MVIMKKIEEFFTPKRLFFIAMFAALAFVTQRINFSALIGTENQFFTLFQFVGPIAGAFLGPVVGVLAVFIAEVTDIIIGQKAVTMLTVLRIAPMLFATYYFATRRKALNIIAPLVAIIAFVIHPIGRQVWFFALYWAIPIVVELLPKQYSDHVLAKSYGATFTAHAVGGMLWIWTVPMTAAQWIALIPVVAYERLLFGAGICVSYLMLNASFDKALTWIKVKVPESVLRINKKYTVA